MTEACLINTPLQRGAHEAHATTNSFNGFSRFRLVAPANHNKAFIAPNPMPSKPIQHLPTAGKEKCKKMSLISLYFTSLHFFHIPKVNPGKETACPPQRFPDHRSAFDEGGWRRRLKFLAIYDHRPIFIIPLFQHSIIPFSLGLPVQPSQAQSNPVKPNPTTPSPSGKEIGKETARPPACFRRRRVKFLAIFLPLTNQLPGICKQPHLPSQLEAFITSAILSGLTSEP